MKKFLFNFKIQKIELLLDIMAYFNNYNIINQLLFLKPKIKILTPLEKEAFAQKYGLNISNHGDYHRNLTKDDKKLHRLNYYIVREHFMLVYWIMKYNQFLLHKFTKEEARILVLKRYVNSSSIYHLLYGKNKPSWLEAISEDDIL